MNVTDIFFRHRKNRKGIFLYSFNYLIYFKYKNNHKLLFINKWVRSALLFVWNDNWNQQIKGKKENFKFIHENTLQYWPNLSKTKLRDSSFIKSIFRYFIFSKSRGEIFLPLLPNWMWNPTVVFRDNLLCLFSIVRHFLCQKDDSNKTKSPLIFYEKRATYVLT